MASLRSRPMLPKDTRECAEIIASHPVIGPRYGAAIADLRPAWLRLLGREATRTAVYEEAEADRVRIVGLGFGVFVSDEFMREMKTPPMFWFGPELVKRTMQGISPVLSNEEVRRANTSGGLNLLVWESFSHVKPANQSALYRLMVDVFVEVYRGFLLKEMITSQMESVERLHWAVDAGAFCWDPTGACYVKSLEESPEEYVRKPHLVGLTSDLEASRRGSWVGAIFDYHSPRFSFSPAEQNLLLAALHTGTSTDQELAKELSVSLPTIKKTWLSVYDRISECEPKLIPGSGEPDSETSKRGKEKRRRLLAYLRDHPEELRPRERTTSSKGSTR